MSALSIIGANRDIYVETTGSDSNDGSAASPLLTVDAACRLLERTFGYGLNRIHVGAGTFDQSINTGNSFSSIYWRFPRLGGAGIGLGVEPPQILGTMADQAGSRTQSAHTNGTAPTFSTVTDSAGGLTPSAHKGQWLRYTSGVSNNRRFLISDNTAAVITLVAFGSTGASDLDTYGIEENATFVRWQTPGTPAQNHWWLGGVTNVDGIEFLYATGGTNNTVRLAHDGGVFTRCRFRETGGGTLALEVRTSGALSFGGPNQEWNSQSLWQAIATGSGCGSVDFVTSGTNSSITVYSNRCRFNARVSGPQVFVNAREFGISLAFESNNNFVFGAGSQGSVLAGRINAAPGATATLGGTTYGGAILVQQGASVRVGSGLDISNTANSRDGIAICGGGYVRATGILSGTGTSTGTGVHVGDGGQLDADSPNVNQTISYTGGAVRIGSTVTPWVNVAKSTFGLAGRLIATTVLAGSGTFTPALSCRSFTTEMLGGGGGGGGSDTAAVSAAVGGGGASGARAWKTWTVDRTKVYSYVVGGGGAAGAAGANDGASGSDTTFDDGTTTVNAKGGFGGGGGVAGTVAGSTLGGDGKLATSGDLNGAGAPGGAGLRFTGLIGISGQGASSPSGGGGLARNAQSAGAAGAGFGAGGSGGCTLNGGAAQAGGAGTAGTIVVQEYT